MLCELIQIDQVHLPLYCPVVEALRCKRGEDIVGERREKHPKGKQ
jgi:hypothetical protein